MIEERNGVFHLQNETASYLFRARPEGFLEQLHFGEPVALEDADALAVRPGLGWGDSVLYDEKSNACCLDVLPLDWSGAGRGDYRESPVELSVQGSPVTTDFCCESFQIHEGCAPIACGLPQSGDGQTLELVLFDAVHRLRLHLYYGVFETAFTRRAVLENSGDGPVTLHKLMSFCVDLPGEYRMHTFNGGWIAEAHRQTAEAGRAGAVNESVCGDSSNRSNCGFLLAEPDAGETCGRVYGFNLVYSGSHYASAKRSLQGLTRVMQGIHPAQFHWTLASGECFETPEAVLAFSSRGFGGLSECMHRHVNGHIIPAYWRNRPRPVLYNSWEGCMFDFTEHKLLRLAKKAKELGCELFVLDDGWFGERNGDSAGLGDYSVNRKKLPGGLKRLGERVNALGLQFGLWFEPEAVNPDSDLYRAHPDWIIPEDRPPLLGRHELRLDLSRPEVRDYIVGNVTKILDSAPISYVKWDMNRHSPALGAQAHRNVLGLYEVLHRIFDGRPELLLESCASGGGRFDLGMLCFSPQIWASDDTDPVERLKIQEGLSYLYPQSTWGAHVSQSPHAQTLRATPLATRGNVSFFGVLGYELDLQELLPVEETEIAAQIEFYKAHRQTFQFGSFRRLPCEKDAVCWQVQSGQETLVGLFHRLLPAAPGYEYLHASGLERKKRYRVTSRPQLLRAGAFGSLLRHAVPVKCRPGGLLLSAVDRHYRMYDGALETTASGAALQAGICLPQRFAGTGYDPSLRVQGDFGSNVFFIEEDIVYEEP